MSRFRSAPQRALAVSGVMLIAVCFAVTIVQTVVAKASGRQHAPYEPVLGFVQLFGLA
ncbi:MAG: hypothetical protein ACRDK8_12220 [Solirubrobacteraceae bacterium]